MNAAVIIILKEKSCSRREWVRCKNSLHLLFFCLNLTVLLILASQRLETFLMGWLQIDTNGTKWISTDVTKTRGAPPSLVEWFILSWVSGTPAASLIFISFKYSLVKYT